MTESKPISEDEKEDIRVGYQVAVELWKREAEQNWARFNVLLVANGIIATAVVVILANPSLSTPALLFARVLSGMGILICAITFLTLSRGFDYQNYYAASAREIEEKYLSQYVRTISRGKRFANGEMITLDLATDARFKMSRLSRLLSAKNLLGVVDFLFFVLYLYVIVVHRVVGS